jgi:hypothetical protein
MDPAVSTRAAERPTEHIRQCGARARKFLDRLVVASEASGLYSHITGLRSIEALEKDTGK